MGKKARQAILEGIRAIGRPVSQTFGPQGRNALLFRTFNRGSRITNDGYTVAQCQEPKDVFVRLAATVFNEASQKTNEKVGDGTTGTALLGWKLGEKVFALLSEGQSSLVSKQGAGVMTLKKQILESAARVKDAIKKAAIEVKSLEDLEKIAIVSVENEELGKTIAKMAHEVGVDGYIDVWEGYKGEIETEVIKGMRFPAKIAHKGFVNNPNRYEMIATDSKVIVTNFAIDDSAGLTEAISGLFKASSKIILIAPSFSDNFLIEIAKAWKAKYFLYPVAVPSLRTDQFEDLSIYCGAKFIDKNKGKNLKNIQISDLGFLEKLIVKDTEAKEDAVATGGAGTQEVMTQVTTEVEEEFTDKNKKVQKRKVKKHEDKLTTPLTERIEVLKAQVLETRQDQFKKLLERRIASMASAIGVIRVGDSTNASALYMKLKIEDAVYACKAALRGGYVKGAGLCLKEIAETLAEDDILKDILEEPYNQIQNSVEGGVVIDKNIIDPAEAVYYAVEHATQVVANLATVDVITTEEEDPVMGEGEYAIARALQVLAVNDKIHKGQIDESQREADLDNMRSSFNGLERIEDVMTLDNG